jgi:ribosome-associated protein
MKPLAVLAPAAVLLIAAPAASWSLADRFAGRVVFPRPRRVAGWVSAASSASSSSSSSSNTNSQQRSAMSTKQHHQEIVNFLDRPVESTVGDNASTEPQGSSSSSSAAASGLEDVQDLVRTIVRAADARKAEQIVALQVHKVTTLTSYLVILSGNSRPQNSAIAAAITRDVLEQFGARPGGSGVPEGSAESGWMVLDYGSVMVHIMTPKSRLFYNVEGQWRQKGGVEMDVSDCVVPNTAADSSASNQEGSDQETAGRVEPAPEDDPFWS